VPWLPTLPKPKTSLARRGAATFVNEETGPSAEVNEANSLVGGQTGGQVGSGYPSCFKNGDYAVMSPNWTAGRASFTTWTRAGRTRSPYRRAPTGAGSTCARPPRWWARPSLANLPRPTALAGNCSSASTGRPRWPSTSCWGLSGPVLGGCAGRAAPAGRAGSAFGRVRGAGGHGLGHFGKKGVAGQIGRPVPKRKTLPQTCIKKPAGMAGFFVAKGQGWPG
jgi:hypothetical protein